MPTMPRTVLDKQNIVSLHPPIGAIVWRVDESFHERNVVILGQVAIFLKVLPTMLWHALDKIFNELIRYERMPEVELGDIGL